MKTAQFAIILCLILVPLAAGANLVYSPCENCIYKATPKVLATIKFRLYGQTIDNFTNVPAANASELWQKLDPGKPTIAYISGWMENPESDSVLAIAGAYLELGEHNVIVADWSTISRQLYPYSAYSVEGVGYTVAQGLNQLVEAGLDPETLHVVGHSLGGQTAGFVGRYTDFEIPRITGLDPAGPGYHILIRDLAFSDGRFVDVIHTDAGVFGNEEAKGHVDFWPNGGTSSQPGCLLSGTLADICSHAKSWQYYAESVLKPDEFVGINCGIYARFTLGLCRPSSGVAMGYGTPSTARGNIYLQTNSESPYGRGAEGKSYKAVKDVKNLLSSKLI